MARGINKVILIGNLGNDPDTRYTPQGSAITNLSVATDESYKDKNTGQIVPKTEWHRVVLFNRLAEISKEYLKKGSKVYLEGRLQTRKWQDQGGQDRYTTEIVANEMQMLDSRGGFDQPQQGGSQQGGYAAPQADQQAGGYAPQQQAPAAPQKPAYQPQQNNGYPNQSRPNQAASPAPAAPAPVDDFDDDIPF